jgi:hypothetical protein
MTDDAAFQQMLDEAQPSECRALSPVPSPA